MVRRIVFAMCCIMAGSSLAGAQAVGRVTGRVTSATGARPLGGVAVVLSGTTRAALTDSAGRFTLAGIPAGSRRLEARRIGFISASQSVNVVAGQSVTADFTLTSSPIELEAVKVVGYGVQSARTVTG